MISIIVSYQGISRDSGSVLCEDTTKTTEREAVLANLISKLALSHEGRGGGSERVQRYNNTIHKSGNTSV